MFPHVLPFAGDMDARQTSDSIKTAEIAWTRVHAIIKSGTCGKCNLSDGDRKAYLTPLGNTRDLICINVKTARSRSHDHSEAQFYSFHGASDFHRTAGKFRGRTPRSRLDRTAIEPRWWIFRRGITSTIIGWRSLEHQYHDRGSFEVKLKLFHR